MFWYWNGTNRLASLKSKASIQMAVRALKKKNTQGVYGARSFMSSQLLHFLQAIPYERTIPKQRIMNPTGQIFDFGPEQE
jgi:hypothetical protein